MPSSETVAAPPKALVAAVRAVLRPLVRLLISKGVGLPAFTELVKDAYVDVAMNEFPVGEKKQTDSRISLLTGVHRKDVKRLRTQKRRPITAPKTIGLGAQIVAHWVGSKDTTDSSGHPLPLPRQAAKAGGPSFDSLVERVSKDVRPRAVLDEWLRLGVARVDADGNVVLNHLAFVPEKGFQEKAFYFGRNVHDHLAAGAHNLLADGAPLLDRSVHYSNLTPESADTLAAAAEKTGMQALLALNRMALELSARDKDLTNATRRVNFGLYFFKGPTSFNDLRLEGEDAPDGTASEETAEE
jgi:hypothetical protein